MWNDNVFHTVLAFFFQCVNDLLELSPSALPPAFKYTKSLMTRNCCVNRIFTHFKQPKQTLNKSKHCQAWSRYSSNENQQVVWVRSCAFIAWQQSNFNIQISQESFPPDPDTHSSLCQAGRLRGSSLPHIGGSWHHPCKAAARFSLRQRHRSSLQAKATWQTDVNNLWIKTAKY